MVGCTVEVRKNFKVSFEFSSIPSVFALRGWHVAALTITLKE